MLMEQHACPKSLFLAIVGTAEANSEHPLAQAICSYVKEVRNVMHYVAKFKIMNGKHMDKWSTFTIVLGCSILLNASSVYSVQ